MAVMDSGANFITLMLPDAEGRMIKQQVKITPSDASVLQDNSILDTSQNDNSFMGDDGDVVDLRRKSILFSQSPVVMKENADKQKKKKKKAAPSNDNIFRTGASSFQSAGSGENESSSPPSHGFSGFRQQSAETPRLGAFNAFKEGNDPSPEQDQNLMQEVNLMEHEPI
jgi:hypothetical protein